MPPVDSVTPIKRPILAISLGVSLSAFVAILAAVLFSGASAEASSYAVSASFPMTWRTAPWFCTAAGPPGSSTCSTYPGSGGVDGDTATINSAGGKVTVDSNIANAVTLNFNCTSCTLDITSPNGILRLTGTATWSNITSTFSISGGTLTNIGTLAMPPNSTFLFHGGTFNGSGATNFAAGAAVNFDGTAGAMTIDGGQTISGNATITLSGANSLNIDNGSTIKFNGGGAAPPGVFNLTSDAPINSVGGGQINLAPGGISPGSLRKTSGTLTNISAVVNNNGQILISTGKIALLGGGTHTGIFDSSAGEYQFDGLHLFQPGAIFGKTTPPVNAHVLGGVFDASTNLSFGGFLQDGGNTKLNNATLTMPPANPFKIYGGNLIGNGTLAGDLATDFGGNISPGIGTAAGTINVTGAFRQSALGFMTVKLNNAGVNDQVNIGGVATLNGGTLKASLNYAAFDGDTWNVFTFASKIGDFTTMNLPPYTRGVIQASYQPPATPTKLQLQAVPQSDIAILKTGPSSVLSGQNASYTVKVVNTGPATPASVTIVDSFTGGTFVSATPTSGTCTGTGPINCTLPAVTPAADFVTVVLKAGAAGTLTNTVSVSSSSPFDPNSSNNSASFTTAIGCPPAPTGAKPVDGAFDVATAGSLTWSDAGAASYNVYLGRVGSGCSLAIGNVTGTSMPYSLQQGTQYEWRVESASPGCPVLSTPCMKFTTINTCPTTPPTLVAPTNGSTVSSPVTFTWTAVGAVKYRVFASVGGAAPTEVGATIGTSLTANIGDGVVTWYVIAEFASPCASIQSATGTFNTCTGVAPVPSLVSEVFTNQTYALTWKAITGAPRYEVDEALDKNFTQSRSTRTVTTTNVSFQHTITVPTAFFYRVRAFIPCTNSFGPYSETMRVVLALVPSPTAPNPNINVPVGSNRLVVQKVHIPGFPDGSFPFVATVDKPWLQVTPGSGLLPPEGIDLTVTADPTTLLNGTQTGTVIVTLTSSFGAIRSNGVTTVNVPVSVTLVTPVSPTTKTLPPANTLIIPSAGHLDGINSRWQSDIRVANVSTQSARFQLTLTPDDLAKGVKQTVITADAGATIALDDIVRNWYGIGSLGEMANGILEIRPLDSVNAVASSRTYNLTSNGTLGQFIPAVPFGKFIGKVTDPNALAPVLGLQQIAQNPDYRTNFGVVEGSGNPVSLLVSVFNAAGAKLLDLPLDLKANEQRQLNFLSQNNISLNDGRIEVKATGGDGKITTYASVIDNRTGDPLLVPGVQLGQAATTDYVLPGVADVNNAFASWRTDMDAFNAGSTPLQATLTFYRQDGGTPKTATVTLNPGELKRLDNVVQSTFDTTNAGGAVHVTTAVPSSLVVTGRTYNQTPGGTFGQFIQAVTAADAVGRLDRALQILQAEDSVRYRTNVGFAEVTGKSAKVEVSVVLPDSKISRKTTIDLPANGFYQANVIQGLGLSNVYNVRVAIKVVSGDGKITAYGSVVDMKTQDPTFVPAQIDQQ